MTPRDPKRKFVTIGPCGTCDPKQKPGLIDSSEAPQYNSEAALFESGRAMAEERAHRRLAAVLAADVAGYSRLMGADEQGTLAALKARRRDILQPLLARHFGRIVKVMGDGVLAEFASAVNAVTCAVELQGAMDAANADLPEDRRIVLRVGINLGDVMVEGSDLYGDGVNIAARLEAIADPGGIFVSGKVRNEVANKVGLVFEDLGERSLKNIAEQVRIYKVCSADAQMVAATAGKMAKSARFSIAILPFINLSGDPEQEYFSDGITEDIITDLSQVSALFVIDRNTAFTFKGKPVEIVQVARRMNVGHVLEGSVRKAGGRVRVTVQLIDGVTGGHLWAERYDRELGDIFALQDEISRSVVGALRVRLLPEEITAITTRSTTSTDAYDCYLQARAILRLTWTNKAMLGSARKLFERSVEIDPAYAEAYAGIADCDAFSWICGDLDVSYKSMLANSSKALELAPNLAEAHASKGLALYLGGHRDEAMAVLEQAIKLNPELWAAHKYYAFSCRGAGKLDRAAVHYERAAEINPGDWVSTWMLADMYEALGQHELGVSAARRSMSRVETALAQHPDNANIIASGAATLVYLGENAKAEEWAKRAALLAPNTFTVRYNVACVHAVIGKSDLALEGLEYIYRRAPRARQWLLGVAKHDTQLNSLRGRPEFLDFMSRLENSAIE